MDPRRAAQALGYLIPESERAMARLQGRVMGGSAADDERRAMAEYLQGGLDDELMNADQMAPSMYDITESPRYPMGELPLQTRKDMRQAQAGREAILSGRGQNLRNASPFQGVTRQSIMDADEAHRAAMMGDDGRDGIAAAAALLAAGGMAGQTVSDHRRGLNVSRDLQRQAAMNAAVRPDYGNMDMTDLESSGDLAALVNESRPIPMSTPMVTADGEDEDFARAYIEHLMNQRFMK